jgi:hypothetical protein
MKKNILSWLLLPVIGMTLFSCTADRCPLSAGSSGSEQRELSDFNAIVLYGKVNLILTQDSVQKITVTGGKNLLPGIATSVSQQTLTIRDNNNCLLTDPSQTVNLYISSPQLQTITYYGAGDIHSTNTLKASTFTVDCWMGSGTIRLDLQATVVLALVRNENATVVLTGAADSAYIYCGEAGSVDMSALPTYATDLDSKTIRDIHVDATHALHANIVYRGNVYYRNSPVVIDTLITSSGRLIHEP